MNDTQKMFQAIINGLAAFKQEVLVRFDKADQKIEKLDKKIDSVEKNLTNRIDKLGLQLAYLEDDTPTREDFDHLADRVDKIEQKIASESEKNTTLDFKQGKSMAKGGC